MSHTLDYIYFDNSFTQQAFDILKKFKRKEVLTVYELLQHDGYDEDGPKSNLYDLWILVKSNNTYIYYFFHWENWFSPNQEKKYILESSYTLLTLSKTSYAYKKFLELANLCKCEDLINKLNKLHKELVV